MSKLKIIVGSTRDGRAAEQVYRWVEARAGSHGSFDVEVLDLRDWPLPFFAETLESVGNFEDPTYSTPIVRRWNEAVKDGDAFVLITPEYNHSFSAVIKNAIDTVFVSFGFRNKPVGFVSYSIGPVGGARAVEQLMLVAVEMEAVPLRDTVLIGAVDSAFDDAGSPVHRATDVALDVLLDDLAWWSSVLDRARAEGELTVGRFRLRAALAP